MEKKCGQSAVEKAALFEGGPRGLHVPEASRIPLPWFADVQEDRQKTGASSSQSSTDAPHVFPNISSGEASSSSYSKHAVLSQTRPSDEGQTGVEDECTDDSSSSSAREDDRDVDFQLGPGEFPGKLVFSASKLIGMGRSSIESRVEGQSTEDLIVLSDVLRMNEGLDGQQLSFGSALHMGDGHDTLCLVCSYHKPPRRFCVKGAFCDFCHLHNGKRRKKPKASAQATAGLPSDVPAPAGAQSAARPGVSTQRILQGIRF